MCRTLWMSSTTFSTRLRLQIENGRGSRTRPHRATTRDAAAFANWAETVVVPTLEPFAVRLRERGYDASVTVNTVESMHGLPPIAHSVDFSAGDRSSVRATVSVRARFRTASSKSSAPAGALESSGPRHPCGTCPRRSSGTLCFRRYGSDSGRRSRNITSRASMVIALRARSAIGMLLAAMATDPVAAILG